MKTYEAIGQSRCVIILTGGRGSRLGGVRKSSLVLGNSTLLDRALGSVQNWDRVVVVGDSEAVRSPAVVRTRESPAYAGPAAALLHGLDFLDPSATFVLVLACDMPDVGDAVPMLMASECGVDGVVAIDSRGRRQHLAGFYRVEALRDAAGERSMQDDSMKSLVKGLHLTECPVGEACLDIDTLADLSRFTSRGM